MFFHVLMVIYKDHITIQTKCNVSHKKYNIKSVNKQEKLCTVIWRLDFLQYIFIYIVGLEFFVTLFKQIHLCCHNDRDLQYTDFFPNSYILPLQNNLNPLAY